MDYGRLINRAFGLAWQHKILWILGLFSVAGGSSLNFGDAFSGNGDDPLWSSFNQDFGDFGSGFDNLDPEMLLPLVGAMALVAMVIGLVFFIASLIATPALIDSVNNITRGGYFTFANSFSRGVDLFWRFFGLFFVKMFITLATVLVCVFIVMLLFQISAFIGVPVALALLFFVIYFLFTLFSLTERAIVVRNCSIGDGLSEGWTLLKNNFGSTMMIALIYMGFNIAFGIMTMIVWLMMGLPVGGITYALTSSPVAAMVLGVLIGLPVSLVIGGFTGTFFSSLYTMYYFELVEPSQPTGHYETASTPPTNTLDGPPPESPPSTAPVDPTPPDPDSDPNRPDPDTSPPEKPEDS